MKTVFEIYNNIFQVMQAIFHDRCLAVDARHEFNDPQKRRPIDKLPVIYRLVNTTSHYAARMTCNEPKYLRNINPWRVGIEMRNVCCINEHFVTAHDHHVAINYIKYLHR